MDGTPFAPLDAFRTLPQNVEIEVALLGAILVDNRAYEKVGEFLAAEHFFEPAHQRIYAAAGGLIERGQQASPATLKRRFDEDDALTEVGGFRYLASLAAAALNIIDAEQYGKEILELAQRRALIGAGEMLVNESYRTDGDRTAAELIEAAEQQLYEVAKAPGEGQSLKPVSAFVDIALKEAEIAAREKGLRGVTTGVASLDSLTGGLRRGRLYFGAGRPGMGKSILGFSILTAAARAGKSVIGFSLEMQGEEVSARMLSAETGIPYEDLERGDVPPGMWSDLVAARGRIAGGNSPFISDQSRLSLPQIRMRARRHQRQHGLDLIVIDHLRHIRSVGRPENRVQAVSEITGGMKALARELGVAVLCLAQLNREVEKRPDKKPMLADLRESGTIEEDADAVWFLYRPAYYIEREKPVPEPDEPEGSFFKRMVHWEVKRERAKNVLDVIVAKNRGGRTGSVSLFIDPATARIGDLQNGDNNEFGI